MTAADAQCYLSPAATKPQPHAHPTCDSLVAGLPVIMMIMAVMMAFAMAPATSINILLCFSVVTARHESSGCALSCVRCTEAPMMAPDSFVAVSSVCVGIHDTK